MIRTVEDSTDKDHRTLVITGQVPVGPPANRRWSVPVPSRFGEVVLSEVLKRCRHSRPSRVSRRARRTGPNSRRATPIRWSSPSTSRFRFPAAARVILKTSQNLHASSMPLLLGSVPGSARRQERLRPRPRVAARGRTEHGWRRAGRRRRRDAFFSPAFMTRFLALVASQPWRSSSMMPCRCSAPDGTLATIQTERSRGWQGACEDGDVFLVRPTQQAHDRACKGACRLLHLEERTADRLCDLRQQSRRGCPRSGRLRGPGARRKSRPSRGK